MTEMEKFTERSDLFNVNILLLFFVVADLPDFVFI